jgi:hypothetical protein
MKERRNRMFAALALIIGAAIGLILGFLYEPTFEKEGPDQPDHP